MRVVSCFGCVMSRYVKIVSGAWGVMCARCVLLLWCVGVCCGVVVFGVCLRWWLYVRVCVVSVWCLCLWLRVLCVGAYGCVCCVW